MYIAICDDDILLSENLKAHLYAYSNKYKLETVIDTFDSGEKLLKCTIRYDIIILDYQMNKMNGLETAKKLRNGINSSSCIIFLTSYPEIAIPAYNVDTYRFVVKNTLYDGLFKALDDYRTTAKPDYIIELKKGGEILKVSTKDIVFFESDDKFVSVHTADGSVITVRSKLSHLYGKMPPSHFFKVHKSYVINFDYVVHQQGNNLKLQHYESSIPISQNYIKSFQEKYVFYLRNW